MQRTTNRRAATRLVLQVANTLTAAVIGGLVGFGCAWFYFEANPPGSYFDGIAVRFYCIPFSTFLGIAIGGRWGYLANKQRWGSAD